METTKFVFNSGDVIFNEGAYEPWLFDIQHGKVGIYADYGTENEKLLTTLSIGQTFGEMGLIERYPRSATAVALDDQTQVTKIDADAFEEHFKARPEALMAIMQQMSQRIRDLTADYLDACRALNETVEGETDTKKKSSLKKKLKKFLDDYLASASAAADDLYYIRRGGFHY